MKRKLFNTIISCVLLTSIVGCNNTNTPAVSTGVVDEDILVANNVDENPGVNTCETLPPERIILEEVPEYISNRGVILRGKDDSWRNRYSADCNLSVVSTDEEFEEFVNVHITHTITIGHHKSLVSHILLNTFNTTTGHGVIASINNCYLPRF